MDLGSQFLYEIHDSRDIEVDELFFITTPDYPTLASTVRAAKLAHYKNVKINGVIVNRVKKKSFEIGIKDIEKTLNLKVVSVIPEDTKTKAIFVTREECICAGLPIAEAIFKKLDLKVEWNSLVDDGHLLQPGDPDGPLPVERFMQRYYRAAETVASDALGWLDIWLLPEPEALPVVLSPGICVRQGHVDLVRAEDRWASEAVVPGA